MSGYRGGSFAKKGREAFRTARVSSCTKVAFYTRRQAKEKARELKSVRGHMRPYRCDDCGFWHIGHLPARIRLG